MKTIFKILLLFVILGNFQYTEAQNLILLKDRFIRDGLSFSGNDNNTYKVSIIDGYIYEINRIKEPNSVITDSNYYNLAKFDLNGNLIRSVRFPFTYLVIDTIIGYNTEVMHNNLRNSTIYKSDLNNLVCFIPNMVFNFNGRKTPTVLYKFNKIWIV